MIKSVKATINKQTYNLLLNEENGLYETSIKAPEKSSYHANENHSYPISIVATDDSGKSSSVDTEIFVRETNMPTIKPINPTEGAYIKSDSEQIRWSVTDDDSGVDINSIKVSLDYGNPAGDYISKTPITNGYECSISLDRIPKLQPITAGYHTIYFSASDMYENNETSSVAFNYDPNPPALQVTHPNDNFSTKNPVLNITGIVSDNVGVQNVTVQIGAGEKLPATLIQQDNYNYQFERSVNFEEKGEYLITIEATDTAGNVSTVTRRVTYDDKPPVISKPVISPQYVNTGEIFTVQVQVTDEN